MARHSPEITLRPETEADLDMFRRFMVEPGLIGLDWSGFRDPKVARPGRRLARAGDVLLLPVRAHASAAD
jgi:[ribosomal protein S5]-alanine N-acetyltransferase